MSLIMTITAVILIIIIVIAGTYVSYYYYQLLSCQYYTSPYCWDDWTCSDGSKPAKEFEDAISSCETCENASTDPNCKGVNAGEKPPGCSCPWNATSYNPTNNLCK